MRLTRSCILLACVAIALCGAAAMGVERFPPPEFESGYELPTPTTPDPRAGMMEYVDLAVLAAALCLATYLAIKKRSRRLIFILMLASLGYFGFYREGCVCAIGAIQNVTLAIFDGGYAIPLFALGFFMLPLALTLLFGRVFCGSVCPLGAIQDVVLLRPVKVPDWLEHALGLGAWVFLTAAVLLAATGSMFLICQYDPLVGFFRLSAGMDMLIIGACVLLIGIFVARPYCRFICPLGAIMRPLSSVSKFRVTITPDECIQCRLCEDSCPFGAIQLPSEPLGAAQRRPARRRLGLLLILLPVLIFAGGWLVSRAAEPLSETHYTVSLADSKRTQFVWGAWLAGGFLGLVIAGKLIALSLHRTRTNYEASRSRCLACGRCFEYCPIEKQRRKGNRPQLKGNA